MSKKRELSRKITEIVGKLPLFPRDIDRLLAVAVKPSGDNKEILRLIESDVGLSTELLLLATALKYLNEYVDHSEDISIGCRILAETSGMERDEYEVYAVAGLIHDIGRLAIMVASNRTSAHVLGTLWDKMASVVHDEKAALGTNHCDVGMQICRKWNFSPIIQEGVLRHHTPLINSDFSLPGALIFTSHFLSASDPSGEILSTLSAAEIVTKLKLSSSDFDKARDIYKSRTENSS
jgi:HD-like signal output (HDOD) protein